MNMKRLVSAAVLAAGIVAASSLCVAAEEAKFELSSSASIRDILVMYAGKRVALRLQSGEEIEGTVTTVGNFLVHVSKLAGKEFFDAVIRIDRISVVRMRMRER